MESSYNYNQTRGLAGTITLGGWNHAGTFEHERLDASNMPIDVTGTLGGAD